MRTGHYWCWREPVLAAGPGLPGGDRAGRTQPRPSPRSIPTRPLTAQTWLGGGTPNKPLNERTNERTHKRASHTGCCCKPSSTNCCQPCWRLRPTRPGFPESRRPGGPAGQAGRQQQKSFKPQRKQLPPNLSRASLKESLSPTLPRLSPARRAPAAPPAAPVQPERPGSRRAEEPTAHRHETAVGVVLPTEPMKPPCKRPPTCRLKLPAGTFLEAELWPP